MDGLEAGLRGREGLATCQFRAGWSGSGLEPAQSRSQLINNKVLKTNEHENENDNNSNKLQAESAPDCDACDSGLYGVISQGRH